MEKKELAERIVEYASNYHWNLEGWGDNVPEDDDLEKELTGIVTFVFEELSKAMEEGKREGILEVLAMFDDYNHPLTFTAEYVREQIIKLLEEENGKQNAR